MALLLAAVTAQAFEIAASGTIIPLNSNFDHGRACSNANFARSYSW